MRPSSDIYGPSRPKDHVNGQYPTPCLPAAGLCLVACLPHVGWAGCLFEKVRCVLQPGPPPPGAWGWANGWLFVLRGRAIFKVPKHLDTERVEVRVMQLKRRRLCDTGPCTPKRQRTEVVQLTGSRRGAIWLETPAVLGPLDMLVSQLHEFILLLLPVFSVHHI